MRPFAGAIPKSQYTDIAEYRRDVSKRSRSRNPQRTIFSSKQNRAKAAKTPFTLQFADMIWPEYCPVLGIRLDYSRDTKGGQPTPSSPSFDRVDPCGGYTPDNTLIVSHRANTVRSRRTPAQMFKTADNKHCEQCAKETRRVAVFYSTLLTSLAKQAA